MDAFGASFESIARGRDHFRRYFRLGVQFWSDEFAPIDVPDEQQFDAEDRIRILPIIQAIADENRKVSIQRRIFVVLEFLLIVASVASASVFEHFAEAISASGSISFWTVVMMSPMFLGFVAPIVLFGLSQRRKRAALLVLETSDIRLLPAILDLRRTRVTIATRDRIVPALIDLLHRIRASDAVVFKDRHRRALRETLTFDQASTVRSVHFVDLRLAVLRCLEQIGNREDLPYVARLAKKEAKTDQEATLVTAAQECLISLGCRLGNDIAGDTLLRPAERVATETLVRPMSGRSSADETTLLRAAE